MKKEKIFSLVKFVNERASSGCTDSRILAWLMSWGVECVGKTKNQITMLGYITIDDWMVEPDDE